MTRSIHSTHARIRNEAQRADIDAEKKAARVRHLKAEVRKKRRIKASVERDRSRAADLDALGSPPALTADAVPVVVNGPSHPAICHPASVEDIRAILQSLPPGTLDGLDRVQLSMAAHASHSADNEGDRDPFVGRPGFEIVPGVWVPNTAGTYAPVSHRIALFPYVLDPSHPLRDIVVPFLRLCELATLVHEVAHHHDHQRRSARGRWRADDTAKVEMYAESTAEGWTRDHVVPFLERAYTEDYRRLADWTRTHGGAALPLHTLTDSSFEMAADGVLRFNTMAVSEVFTGLVEAVLVGDSDEDRRFEFAYFLGDRQPQIALDIATGIRADYGDGASGATRSRRTHGHSTCTNGSRNLVA